MPTIRVIPYVNEETKRGTHFSLSMEKAALLCLAEAKRKRPKILRGAPKEIEYIAKAQYPVWGVPWRGRCIIVDGLGLSTATISHTQIPNVAGFTEDLMRTSISFCQFQEALEKHAQTFRHFSSTEKKDLGSLIEEENTLDSLLSLINQVSVAEEAQEDSVLLPPKVLIEEAERSKERLDDEWQETRSEILALQYALETLKREKERHKQKASTGIEQTQRNYGERIAETRKTAEKNIAQITRERDQETKNAAKLHEKRLSMTIKEERKVQEKIERLRLTVEENLRKHERQGKGQKKKPGLDSKTKFYREQIGELSKKSRDLSKLTEKTRREGEETLRKIEEKYRGMVANETEKIESLEKLRDAEVSKGHEAMKKMGENAAKIEYHLSQLMEQKNEDLKRLEETTLPSKMEETTLIGISFYLVQYKTAKEPLVDVYPPVTAAAYEGIIKRIEKKIFSFSLETRIQLLLNPRSKALNETLFANLKKKLEKDPTLKENVCQVGRSGDLLEMPRFRDEITEGLDGLIAEGWIDAEEKDNILGVYIP